MVVDGELDANMPSCALDRRGGQHPLLPVDKVLAMCANETAVDPLGIVVHDQSFRTPTDATS